MLMENNGGGSEGLFGHKEVQRTWHVGRADCFPTRTFVMVITTDEVRTMSLFSPPLSQNGSMLASVGIFRLVFPSFPPLSPCVVSPHHPEGGEDRAAIVSNMSLFINDQGRQQL